MSRGSVDEATRLRLLADYGIMDTGPDPVLDQIVALAATICNVPIALISLVDDTRQWFKAKVGLDAQQTPRELAFCAHAIEPGRDGLFVVGDARVDARFASNPLVTGDPHVVFYTGAPLEVEAGAKLGTLCVIDHEPRALTTTQSRSLEMLADLVVQHLQRRRDEADRIAAQAWHEAVLTSIGDAVVSTDASLRVAFMNPVAERLSGWTGGEAKGQPIDRVLQLVDESTQATVESPLARALREERVSGFTTPKLLMHRDGRTTPIEDSAAPIRNARGEITGAVLVFRDVTDMRRERVRRETAEAAMRRSELRYRTLFDSIEDGFCVVEMLFDANGRPVDYRYLEANAAVERLTGLQRLVGRRVREVLSDLDAEWFEVYGNVALTGHPARFERFLSTTNQWYDVSVARIGEADSRQVALVFKDLTARKREEAERNQLLDDLEGAHVRLQNLIEHAPAIIATFREPDHRLEMFNEPYQRLMGAGRPIVGRTLAETVPEMREQGLIDLLDGVYRTGVPFRASELPIQLVRHADGVREEAFVELVFQPSRSLSGVIQGVDLFGFDVTEHVRARRRIETLSREIAASESRLRHVLDALPVLVSFVTADVQYGLVNQAYENWFGKPAREIEGHRVRDVIGEAAYTVLRPHVERALAGESFSFESAAVPYRSGGSRDVKVSFVSRRDASGRPDGYVALLEDVTALRRLEAERDRLALQYREVLESMGDAFFALDPSWRFTLVNHRYEEIAQRNRGETLGRVFWELFPDAADPASKYYQSYHRTMSERVPVEFVDYYAPLALWTEVRSYPTADGGIATFFRDVSAQVRADEALKERVAFERQLIGIVSHDLRNPLNVILGSATTLLRKGGIEEHTLRSVVRIQSSAERAATMVRDLLDFTQARLSGIPVVPRATDLHTVLRNVADEVQAAYPERRLEVRLEGDGAGTWDPDRLAQAVQNLVTNAVKYSPAETTVTITSGDEDDGVRFAVHNAGAPIRTSLRPRLFAPMTRGDEVMNSADRSVGLGLYIVDQIVRAHGGAIDVQSTAATGTTFTVRLPRHAIVTPAPSM